MRVRAYRVENSPKLMIIPMIDIIFFLLVFFMMSTLNMVYQKSLPINLPLAAASQQDLVRPVTVTMTETGRIQLDQEELSLETLAARMRGRLDGQPQTPVILRADQSAEHGKVVAVMDQLKIAGVQKLAIATQQKQR